MPPVPRLLLCSGPRLSKAPDGGEGLRGERMKNKEAGGWWQLWVLRVEQMTKKKEKLW